MGIAGTARPMCQVSGPWVGDGFGGFILAPAGGGSGFSPRTSASSAVQIRFTAEGAEVRRGEDWVR